MSCKVFHLQVEDKKSLKNFVRKSKEELRAQVLLLLDKGYKNAEIAEILDIHRNTVSNIKRKYLEGGCENALHDKPRPGQPKKYGIEEETIISALACTNPPEGHKRWTIRLLVEKLRNDENFESISYQSVRLILKKTS
jgi:transposase